MSTLPPNTKIVSQRGGSVPPTGGFGRKTLPSGPQAKFTGDRTSLFKLLLVNLFLTILTLGIYRFWAKTKVRAYMLGHVKLLGDRFEYTGTGGELFKGFLLAIAVLFVLGLISTVFDLLSVSHPMIGLVGQLIYLAGLTCLIHIAIFRSTRYRLTRTQWRGIRLNMDGSQSEYLKKGMLWTLISVLTLGLAYPWAQTRLLEYRVNHARFGRNFFAMSVDPKNLLPWWLATYGFLFIGGILFWSLRNAADATALVFLGLGLFVALIVVNVGYRIHALNTYINGTSYSGMAIRSRLSIGGVIGRLALCQILFFALLGGLIAGSGVLDLIAAGGEPGPEVLTGVGITIVAGFFALSMLSGIITKVVMVPYVLGALCHHFSIADPNVFDQIIQGAKDDLTHGEGLMDGLDADGFDAIG